MDLALDRVSIVAERLDLLKWDIPCVTVGGTNGKGSTVTALECIYNKMGYRTGVFTSPYLLKFNEYIRINAVNAVDEVYCRAFAKIRIAQEDISLTTFEFVTLAALLHFRECVLDVLLLEVGLGGRLDSVNIIDADVSIITSIGLDHQAILGNTREAIAIEKAGICRANKPLVCGDLDPPASLIHTVQKLTAKPCWLNKNFWIAEHKTSWDFHTPTVSYQNIPHPNLILSNMACAIMTVELLQTKLPVTPKAINDAMSSIIVPGRVQVINRSPEVVLDVSHNIDSIKHLCFKISEYPKRTKQLAVFSMLEDKNIRDCIVEIAPHIDEWHIAPLAVPRGISMIDLKAIFASLNIAAITHNSIADAYAAVRKNLNADDRLFVFGSFHTVSQVITFLR